MFCQLCDAKFVCPCRQVTCVEVVDTFIVRIKEVNPLLNVVVADRFDDARRDAAKVDRILDSGSIPDELSEQNAPYLGVPLTIKEAISVAGNDIFTPPLPVL